MVSRRRRELVELARRLHERLPDQQVRFGRVGLAYAGVPVALELAGAVVAVRTTRQLWRVRKDGSPALLGVVRRSPLLPLVLAHAAYRWVARILLVRWLRRRLASPPG